MKTIPKPNRLTAVRARHVLVAICLAAICLWPVFIINKGIDLTDAGYYLANYQTAFSGNNVIQLPYGLANWLGGLLYHIFPSAQYLVLCIACLLCYAAITLLTYFTLRKYFSTWVMLVALMLASLLVPIYPYIASYNTFSFLFLAAAVFLLMKSLQSDNLLLLLFSAVIIGLNVLNRLPNLLQFPLVGVCFWYYGFCLKNWKKAAIRSAQFLGVALVAFGLLLTLFLLTNNTNTIWTDLNWLFALASTPGQNYSLGGVFGAILNWNELRMVLPIAAGVILAPLALWQAILLLVRKKKLLMKRTPILLWILIALAAAFGSIYALLTIPSTYTLGYFLFILGLTTSLAGLLLYRRKQPLFSALSGVQLVLVLSIPFGSYGMFMTYYLYLHFILAFLFGMLPMLGNNLNDAIYRRYSGSNPGGGKPGGNLPVRMASAALAGILLVSATYITPPQPYRDSPYSTLDTQARDVPLLYGLRTSSQRAAVLEEYYAAVQPYTAMPLISMGDFPLACPLADMSSFFSIAWPDLDSFPVADFSYQLANAEAESNYPLITVIDIDQDGINTARKNLPTKMLVLEEFMARNSYMLVLDNGYFQIYAPGSMLLSI